MLRYRSCPTCSNKISKIFFFLFPMPRVLIILFIRISPTLNNTYTSFKNIIYLCCSLFSCCSVFFIHVRQLDCQLASMLSQSYLYTSWFLSPGNNSLPRVTLLQHLFVSLFRRGKILCGNVSLTQRRRSSQLI